MIYEYFKNMCFTTKSSATFAELTGASEDYFIESKYKSATICSLGAWVGELPDGKFEFGDDNLYDEFEDAMYVMYRWILDQYGDTFESLLFKHKWSFGNFIRFVRQTGIQEGDITSIDDLDNAITNYKS